MNVFEQLAEFHNKFEMRDIPVGEPQLLSPALFPVRANFIGEELNEYVEAHTHGDVPHLLRELIDIVYVVIGTIDLHGFTPKQAQEAFNRVHAANMAKVRVESAKQSKRGTTYDVRKPEGWKAPDLDDLCEWRKA